jgi:site-specific recombinase XerD
MNITTLEGGAFQKSFDDHVELFLCRLRAAGYAERTLRNKRWALRRLAQWAQRRGIAVADFHDRHAAAFLARSSGRAKDFVAVQRRTIRQFLRFFRSGTGNACPPSSRNTSVEGGLLRDYEDYLRNKRGLAENSLHVYIPFIRSFLTSQRGRTDCVSQRWLKTLAIRDFVLDHIQGRSGEYVRLLGTALRSFLRFLFLSGRIARDLSPSVPTVRKYRQAVPPALLSPEEVECVLEKTDRSTSTGRRAIPVSVAITIVDVQAELSRLFACTDAAMAVERRRDFGLNRDSGACQERNQSESDACVHRISSRCRELLISNRLGGRLEMTKAQHDSTLGGPFPSGLECSRSESLKKRHF